MKDFRQNGAAVIVAMLVVALAAMAASAFLLRAQVEWRKLENAAHVDQARWVLRAAEQWGAAVLLDDARTSAVDHLGENWAMQLPPVDAEGYRIEGRMQDQDGRFNLNNLMATRQVVPQQLAILRRLLATLRLPAELAPAVADWLSTGGQSRPPGEAGSAHHPGSPQAQRGAGRPLVALNELLGVKGMSAEVLENLKPFVTVLPVPTRVNVNTARPELLAALVEGLSLEQAYAMAARRDRAWFRSVQDFTRALPERLTCQDDLVAISSRYFLVTVRIRHERINVGSRALFDRSGAAYPELVWRAAL